MNSLPAGFWIGAGLFTLCIALSVLAVTYIQLRKHKWPLLTGRVVWTGDRDSLREQGNQEYVSGSLTMNVLVRHENKQLELSFSNAPSTIKVNDQVQLRAHLVFPQLFNTLDISVAQPLAVRILNFSFGALAGLLLSYLGFILIQLGRS